MAFYFLLHSRNHWLRPIPSASGSLIHSRIAFRFLLSNTCLCFGFISDKSSSCFPFISACRVTSRMTLLPSNYSTNVSNLSLHLFYPFLLTSTIHCSRGNIHIFRLTSFTLSLRPIPPYSLAWTRSIPCAPLNQNVYLGKLAPSYRICFEVGFVSNIKRFSRILRRKWFVVWFRVWFVLGGIWIWQMGLFFLLLWDF